MRFGPAGVGPLSITVDGRPYTLLVPTAGHELAAVAAAGQWPQIMPGLLAPEEREEVTRRIRDPYDPMTLHACWRIALGVAPELYGMEWWAAGRLCALAVERWRDWSAWCVHRGLDVDTASAHRIASAVWAWLLEHVQEEKDVHRLERQVFDPPPELRRTGRAAPAGFSDAELAGQAAGLAADAAADGW